MEIVPVSLAPAAPAVPPRARCLPRASRPGRVPRASPPRRAPRRAPRARCSRCAPRRRGQRRQDGYTGGALEISGRRAGSAGRAWHDRILGQDQVRGPRQAGTARSVLAGLQADPQLLWWARRAVVLVSVGAVMTFLTDWQIGLPVAAVAATADMLCHSRTRAVIPAAARVTSAQRQTRRRLARTAPSGYISIHQRAIPGTGAVVDHLVIGPAGVYAVSSQHWDRRLPVRATQGGQLYHGPFDQSGDLGNARWQAGQVEPACRRCARSAGRRPRRHGHLWPHRAVGCDQGRRGGRVLRPEAAQVPAARGVCQPHPPPRRAADRADPRGRGPDPPPAG